MRIARRCRRWTSRFRRRAMRCGCMFVRPIKQAARDQRVADSLLAASGVTAPEQAAVVGVGERERRAGIRVRRTPANEAAPGPRAAAESLRNRKGIKHSGTPFGEAGACARSRRHKRRVRVSFQASAALAERCRARRRETRASTSARTFAALASARATRWARSRAPCA